MGSSNKKPRVSHVRSPGLEIKSPGLKGIKARGQNALRIKAPAQGGEAGDDLATICLYDPRIAKKVPGPAGAGRKGMIER